jgi:AcrR family transcriptional regulator
MEATVAEDAPPGLRERKKQRTAEQLSQAAVQLFAARGFDETTIEDIAAAAEVSPRTFFRYFASKEDVVLAGLLDAVDVLGEAIESRPADEPVLTAVHRAALSLADFYAASREHLLVLARLIQQAPSVKARDLELRATWEDRVTADVARRLRVDPARDLRPRLVATVALAALHVAVESWITRGGRCELPPLVDEAFALIDAGLDVSPPAKGRRR